MVEYPNKLQCRNIVLGSESEPLNVIVILHNTVNLILRFSQPLWKVSGHLLSKYKLKQGLACYIWLEGSCCTE